MELLSFGKHIARVFSVCQPIYYMVWVKAFFLSNTEIKSGDNSMKQKSHEFSAHISYTGWIHF